MNRHDAPAPTTGGRRRNSRHTTNQIAGFAVGIIGLMLFGALALGLAPSAGGAGHAVALTATTTVTPFAAGPHGDLIVNAADSPFIIEGSGGAASNVYYEQGNITVQSGGTLEVINATLSFVQFIASNGNASGQLAYLYSFQNQGGTIDFTNAALTTDLNVLNPFPKLNFTVQSGGVWVNSSTFDFPGSLYVNGSASQLNFWNSTVTGNPTLFTNDSTIQNDSVYAPTLFLTNGAHVNLLESHYVDYYANALGAQNDPAAGPFSNFTAQALPANSVAQWTQFGTGGLSGADELARASLYSTMAAGLVTLTYNTSASQSVPAFFNYTASVGFGANFEFAAGGAQVSEALPAGTIQEINAQGIGHFLSTVTSHGSAFYLDKSAVGAGNLNVTSVTITLVPKISYDMVAAGPGTTLTAADSYLGLNWVAAPANHPWLSQKLDVVDSAAAYLASVSVPPYSMAGYNLTSFVQPDATSIAYVYRWLQVNVAGEGNQAVTGAQATAFYAYGTSQANNATTTRMNALGTANPTLAAYAVQRATLLGAPAYGASNGSGVLRLLLLTGVITSATLPNSNFTGDYHIGISVPSPPAEPAKWTTAALTAFTAGMNLTTSPDLGGSVLFPSYVPAPPIAITYAAPTGTVNTGGSYGSSGTVTFAGPAVATISVIAVGPNGDTQSYLVGSSQSPSGTFSLAVNPPVGMPAGTYTLTITATENGVTSQIVQQNALTVSAGGPTNFLNQKFFGLEMWTWLAIAAAIVAAVVVVLFMFQRTARGKLVECGECGELIPESATQCPKCGAEFESALVRCSRCGSTIPASSKVCPECAAQLLGDPAEEQSDPERQGYADFVDRYRALGKKELGENFTEGAFWDWWKRQPTYLPFSQWRLQQAGTSRAGMTAPPAQNAPATQPAALPAPAPPARRGSSAVAPAAAATAVAAPKAAGMTPTSPQRGAYTAPPASASYAAPPATSAPAPAAVAAAPAAAQQPGLRGCSNCGKEIPSDYLVCPFCGAVTR